MEVRKGYKQTEVGIIPEDWDVKALGELGEFKNGINKGKEDFGFGHPFVNLMDVFGIPKISDSSNFGLINSTDVDRKMYELKKGDVLFVRSSVKPVGVGLTTLIAEDLPDTVFSGFLIRFRNKDDIAHEFKEHCFYDFRFRNRLIANSTVSANTNINQDALKALLFAFPKSKDEQQAIAAALSDVDALLNSLDALIAKKRLIKQGAMQELLTGKKRLPGFSGEWEVKRIGQVLKLRYGKSQNGVVVTDGKYPIIGTGGEVGRTNHYLYDRPSIIIGRKGTIDDPKYIDTPFWTIDTAFYSEVSDNTNPKFLFYKFCTFNWYLYNEASGVPSLNATTVESVEISIPPSLAEQTAIAEILSDMDAEISALEQKREKTRLLKQGMMQELLTGRIRLL